MFLSQLNPHLAFGSFFSMDVDWSYSVILLLSKNVPDWSFPRWICETSVFLVLSLDTAAFGRLSFCKYCSLFFSVFFAEVANNSNVIQKHHTNSKHCDWWLSVKTIYLEPEHLRAGWTIRLAEVCFIPRLLPAPQTSSHSTKTCSWSFFCLSEVVLFLRYPSISVCRCTSFQTIGAGSWSLFPPP